MYEGLNHDWRLFMHTYVLAGVLQEQIKNICVLLIE